jgi:integral membrane protein (TIGR01906 family)
VNALGGRPAAIVIGIATAILIVTVAIVPFLTPQWVAFEQGRSQATAWTGFTTDELRVATDAILADLIFGGDFDVELAGQPVLNTRERAHMGDVRTVFDGLWVLALISVVVVGIASRRGDRAATWRSVRRGALGLTVGVVVVGAIGLIAFDQLFSVFHQVFFPAGSYLFDPRTDRLVQLFPFQFWDETAMVVGAVIIAISLPVAWVAGRRAGRQVTTPAHAVPPAEPQAAAAAEPGS